MKDLKQFIANAKDKPIEYASAGVGTGSYIAAEYVFRVLAKVQTVHVPFPGGGPAVTAVLGNHVGAMAATVPGMIAHINAGKLRGIGIASTQRLPALPDVPTYIERGFNGFTAAAWVGFLVPANPHAAVVARLNLALNEALRGHRPGTVQAFRLELLVADAAATKRFFDSEVDHWGKMVQAIGVSINDHRHYRLMNVPF